MSSSKCSRITRVGGGGFMLPLFAAILLLGPAREEGIRYLAFPDRPTQSTASQAVTHASETNWVSVTDLVWRCDLGVWSHGKSATLYVPASDRAGQVVVIIGFEGSC